MDNEKTPQLTEAQQKEQDAQDRRENLISKVKESNLAVKAVSLITGSDKSKDGARYSVSYGTHAETKTEQQLSAMIKDDE